MKAIVAMAENRVIGYHGKIPWHLSEDLKFFKSVTWGKAVVMGRKTYESIGRPLPGRQNIVLSRKQNIPSEKEVIRVGDVSTVLRLCEKREAFVIGGELVYRALLPWCNEILVTHVKEFPEGDTFFPVFEDEFNPGIILREDERMKIVRYSRLSGSARGSSSARADAS